MTVAPERVEVDVEVDVTVRRGVRHPGVARAVERWAPRLALLLAASALLRLAGC